MVANKRRPTPPRDVIGDVEGCYFELLELIEKLNYKLILSQDVLPEVLCVKAPGKRKLVFAGDLINRGPHPDLVLNLLMQLTRMRIAIVVTGNQEKKYLRVVRGQAAKVHPDVQKTVDTVAAHGPEFVSKVQAFLESLPFKYETDRLIVVHAAYRDGVDEKKAEELALFGETDGTLDKRGQPVRLTKWETDYQGTKTIVHGHTALRDVSRRDLPSGAKIFNIDTKAAFGNKLTSLRFPRLKIVQVPSRAEYVKSWDD